MKKFEILNLEKKSIARLNDQQIIAVKGGKAAGDTCIFRTSTVNCNAATASCSSSQEIQ